jgi:hypothetical protein
MVKISLPKTSFCSGGALQLDGSDPTTNSRKKEAFLMECFFFWQRYYKLIQCTAVSDLNRRAILF